MYAQYSGPVVVQATSFDSAVEAALHRLKTGAFPNRTKDMWIVEKVERTDL
jgi:hypothetical protein